MPILKSASRPHSSTAPLPDTGELESRWQLHEAGELVPCRGDDGAERLVPARPSCSASLRRVGAHVQIPPSDRERSACQPPTWATCSKKPDFLAAQADV